VNVKLIPSAFAGEAVFVLSVMLVAMEKPA